MPQPTSVAPACFTMSMTRSGDDRVEQALAAKQDVLHAGDGLNIDLTAGGHCGQMAGVHHDALTVLKLIIHHMAVELGKDDAVSADALEDEALAAEQAAAQLLLEVDGQLHAGFAGQKRALLEDQLLAGSDLKSLHRAGKTGCEGDHARAALGGIDVLEHLLAGEHTSQRTAKSAVGGGLHLHVRGHPRHAAALGDHSLTGRELTDDDGKGLALDLILHVGFLLFLSNGQVGHFAYSNCSSYILTVSPSWMPMASRRSNRPE